MQLVDWTAVEISNQNKMSKGEFEVAYFRDSSFLAKSLPTGTVSAMNERYGFNLLRSEAHGSFALTHLIKADDVDYERRIQSERDLVFSSILSPYRFYGRFTWDLMNGSEIKISSVRSTAEREVTVEFDVVADSQLRLDQHVTSGILQFNLDNYALRQFVRYDTSEPPAKSVMKIESTSTQNDLAKFVRVEFLDYNNKGVNTFKSVLEAKGDLVDLVVPGRDVFYLSGYGLPEPNFGGVWYGTWVWYLVIGVVCIVIARLIMRQQFKRV